MLCLKCGTENEPKVSFCKECGNQLLGEKIDVNDVNKKYFVQTLVLFLCIALIIVSSRVFSLSFLNNEILFSGLLVVTTLFFAILDWRSFTKIFRFSFRIKLFLKLLIGAPVLAFLVIQLARLMNQAFDFEVSSYYIDYQLYTSNMYFFGILFVSLMPGFFEEFLFRGILFNHLLKLTTPKSTILITGILFSFLHFAFMSLPWLILIGFLLGYLRFRYRTIWYGIFFHALYNASVFFMEIYI